MRAFNKILIYSVLALSVFTLNSCFEEPGSENILTEQFVSFGAQDGNISITESDLTDTLLVEISYAQASDVTVTYEVTESGVIGGVDYEIVSSSPITIPAGAYSVKVPINVTNNFVYDGVDPRTFTITLTGVSASGVGINGVTSATVSIVDDDCPFNLADWEGVYTVAEAFTSGVNAPNGFSDFFGESYQVELTANPADPNSLSGVLTNSAGFDQYFVDGTVIAFNTCGGTVSFPAGNPNLANFVAITVQTTSFNANDFTIRVDGPAGGYGPYGFTLTKQ